MTDHEPGQTAAMDGTNITSAVQRGTATAGPNHRHQNFYTESSAETKAELAPFLEELQRKPSIPMPIQLPESRARPRVRPAHREKPGFTLIELAIVIAIIAILAALLLPAISRTKELGRSTVCLNNLHQIGVACKLYVQDNQNRLPVMYDHGTNDTPPPGPAINQVLLPTSAACPTSSTALPTTGCSFELTGSSYAWNVLLNGQDADHLQMLTNAYLLHQIFVVFDKEKFHFARGERRAINYLYADGHIKNLMELQSIQ